MTQLQLPYYMRAQHFRIYSTRAIGLPNRAIGRKNKRILQGAYIDLTSDKIKLYVRKNLTAAFCDMVGQFTRERLIHVLF